AEIGVHRVTGAVAECNCIVVVAVGVHCVIAAVAESDFVVTASEGLHRVIGAVAKRDFIVAAKLGAHEIIAAVANDDMYPMLLSANTEMLSALPWMIVVVVLWGMKPLPVISKTVPWPFTPP